LSPHRTFRRGLAGIFLALLLTACSSDAEPDNAAIGEAIERMHREWSAERRKDQRTQTPELFRRLPNVNLAFEANLALRITSVRKVSCKRTGDQRLGHVCLVVIAASLAGRPPVIQNMEGRLVRGTDGWQVRDITVLEAPG
jgi:hypothetical protein